MDLFGSQPSAPEIAPPPPPAPIDDTSRSLRIEAQRRKRRRGTDTLRIDPLGSAKKQGGQGLSIK